MTKRKIAPPGSRSKKAATKPSKAPEQPKLDALNQAHVALENCRGLADQTRRSILETFEAIAPRYHDGGGGDPGDLEPLFCALDAALCIIEIEVPRVLGTETSEQS